MNQIQNNSPLLALAIRQFFTNERMKTRSASGLGPRVQNTLLNLHACTLRDVLRILSNFPTFGSFNAHVRREDLSSFGRKAWDAMCEALASEGITFPIQPELLEEPKIGTTRKIFLSYVYAPNYTDSRTISWSYGHMEVEVDFLIQNVEDLHRVFIKGLELKALKGVNAVITNWRPFEE